MNKNNIVLFYIMLTIVFQLVGCNKVKQNNTKTSIAIQGGKWYINNTITNQGTPAEGLLMNVRMVNSVFEDLSQSIPKDLAEFNPGQNTNAFLSKLPEYVNNGVNAFTISLQGGGPGYEGAINTAYRPDGSLKEEYLKRVEKIILASDANNAIVILSCFYQRQHSHPLALNGKKSIKNALKNVVNWITRNNYDNVVLEIANEYKHGGYKNWSDGKWLMSEVGQVELIKLAKQLNPSLLVSTSGMGNGRLDEQLISESDFLIVHFNNTSLADYGTKIRELKKYGKPIVCNEDDKLKQAGVIALSLSVLNGCGWGYMNSHKNQYIPFEFDGIDDDPEVYGMFKKVTSVGYQINSEMTNHTFINIISPNDGQTFTEGQSLTIQVSLINPPKLEPFYIDITANNEVVTRANEQFYANWLIPQVGIFNLKAILKNQDGKALYVSPNVDIIVQSKK